jgi:hypothetical protein
MENLNLIIKEIEREKRMEAKVFHVVWLCEPMFTGCSPYLLYSPCIIFLDDYNVL